MLLRESEGAIIVLLAALTKSVVKIAAIVKVFQCTAFQKTKLSGKNGRILFKNTEKTSCHQTSRVYVRRTLMKTVMRTGQFPSLISQIWSNHQDLSDI